MKSNWNKRVFYSFLIGFVTISFLTLISLLLIYPAELFGLNWLAGYIYAFFSVGLAAYLFNFRYSKVKQPLSSNLARAHFRANLFAHRTYWVWIMVVSSMEGFFLVLFSSLINPFLDTTFLVDFAVFLFCINYFIVIGFTALLWFVTQLSFLSSEFTLKLVIDCIFRSFNKGKICCLKNIFKGNCRSRAHLGKFARINFDFIAQLFIALLLVAILIIAQASFQMFVPSVAVIQTPQPSGAVEFFLLNNDTVLYTMTYEQSAWINVPLDTVFNLKLKLTNPSNLTTDYIDSVHSFYRQDLMPNVVSNNPLNCTLVKGSKGDSYIEITALKGYAQINETPWMKLSYSSYFDLNVVKITTKESALNNGSTLVSTMLIMNNTTPYDLYADSLPLFLTQDYGNLTSFYWYVNGNQRSDNIAQIMNQFFWFPVLQGLVSAHSFTNITLSAVFGEKS